MLPMIHEVARRRPDRIIWGSNWPHPIYTGPMPNDGDLVDLIPMWIPDPDVRHRMLVENPASLYGFPAKGPDGP
jgi:predicted TIM-barrel fold metal-dependent hydrolase